MWIRRRDPAAEHRCAPPTREATYTVPHPFAGAMPVIHTETVADGSVGDLWRCDDCRSLWRIGDACDWCDHYGPRAHPGTCTLGEAWRSAPWWTRLRYLRAGRGAK